MIPDKSFEIQGLPLSDLYNSPLVRNPVLSPLFMSGQVKGVAFYANQIHITFTEIVDVEQVALVIQVIGMQGVQSVEVKYADTIALILA